MDDGDISSVCDVSMRPSVAYQKWNKYDGGDMFFAVMLSALIGLFIGLIAVVIIDQCVLSEPVCESSENYTVCKDVYHWESPPYIKEPK